MTAKERKAIRQANAARARAAKQQKRLQAETQPVELRLSYPQSFYLYALLQEQNGHVMARSLSASISEQILAGSL
jgi:hypothetical protein